MKSRIYYRLSLTGVSFLCVMFCGCLSQKKVVYFQENANKVSSVSFDTSFVSVIHPNDILNIFVTSINAEASKYFNFSVAPEATSANATTPGNNGYLVDANGFIQLPLVGSVKVGGLTTSAAKDTLVQHLAKYIESPTIKLNIQNFKVTMLGEITRPAVYYISSEKMTITDALSLAGDLTLYGRRDNIMVVREENGKKTFGMIDITSRDFFSSPYYNLHSNDIIYIEPIKAKKYQAENLYKVLPLLLSTVSVAIVLIKIYQ